MILKLPQKVSQHLVEPYEVFREVFHIRLDLKF